MHTRTLYNYGNKLTTALKSLKCDSKCMMVHVHYLAFAMFPNFMKQCPIPRRIDPGHPGLLLNAFL